MKSARHATPEKCGDRTGLSVTLLSFTSTPDHLQKRGMLGWISIRVGDEIVIDSIGLRRTRTGDLRLSFPTRKDSHGNQHAIVRPASREAHEAIERAVFAALGGEVVA